MVDLENPFEPNSEDGDGPYWDPWEVIAIPAGGYSSSVDLDAIYVLRAIRDGVASGKSGGDYKNYVTDISKRTGMSESHVELWQYIFCSANWCDYGTSPRGCFPADGLQFDALITAWEAYYLRRWKEDP